MHIHSLQFGLDRTGGLMVLVRYLEAMERAGHSISISTLGSPHDPRFISPPSTFDVRYLGLRGKPYKAGIRIMPGNWPFPNLEWRRLMSAAPTADLYYIGSSLALQPIQDRNIPIYYHVQHYEPLISNGRLAISASHKSYSGPAYITANCSWVAEKVVEAGGIVQDIIPPGFDQTLFNYIAPRNRDRSTKTIRILTLGKSVAWKGLNDVVTATRMLADQLPGLSVELHSYGPNRPRSSLGRAKLVHHGLVDLKYLSKLHRLMTIAVSGSWYESFPLPPLEGMASGTPVITTPIGTEDYAIDGTNCLLVPSSSPSRLTERMRELILDTAMQDELAYNGKKTAACFPWERAEAAVLEHVAKAVT